MACAHVAKAKEHIGRALGRGSRNDAIGKLKRTESYKSSSSDMTISLCLFAPTSTLVSSDSNDRIEDPSRRLLTASSLSKKSISLMVLLLSITSKLSTSSWLLFTFNGSSDLVMSSIRRSLGASATGLFWLVSVGSIVGLDLSCCFAKLRTRLGKGVSQLISIIIKTNVLPFRN